jgi:hypothetical protein
MQIILIFPVRGSGGGVGGASGGVREILPICTGNSDRNFIETKQNHNLKQLSNTRNLAGNTKPSELEKVRSPVVNGV